MLVAAASRPGLHDVAMTLSSLRAGPSSRCCPWRLSLIGRALCCWA